MRNRTGTIICAALAGVLAGALLVAQAPAASPATRAREVLNLFFAQKYDAIYEMFAPETKKALALDAFKTQGRQLAALGPAKTIDEPRVETAGEATAVRMTVHWTAVTLDFGVRWNKNGQIIGLWFSAPPVDWQRPVYSFPDSFTEQQVTVGEDEWKLPGTLTVPKGDGPFPGLVLVHGSGPNDRNETVGGTKVFRDLAEGLASRGIACLRYDKRSRVYGARMAAASQITVNEEVIEDVARAADLLRTQPKLNASRVFVLGHSLGGYLAPRILKADPKLAGMVILAGSARPIEDLMLEQVEYLMSLKSSISADDQKKVDDLKQEIVKVKKLEPGKDNPSKVLGQPSSYFLDLKGYSPTSEIKKFYAPLLVLQGERDYQVTMMDFALWTAALRERKNVTLRSYPYLNHLFIVGEGKSTPSEYQQPRHVSGEVITDIAKWILGIK